MTDTLWLLLQMVHSFQLWMTDECGVQLNDDWQEKNIVTGKTLVSAILFTINPIWTTLKLHQAFHGDTLPNNLLFFWHSRGHLKCDVMNSSCVLVTQHDYKCLKTTLYYGEFSCSLLLSKKVISVTYSQCVSVALVMGRILLSSVPGVALPYFLTLPHERRDLRQKGTEYRTCG